MTPAEHAARRWQRLSDDGREATRHGDFARALTLYREACRVAEALEDPEKQDASDLNVAMVLIQMGDARSGEDGLREILLRTTDPTLAFTAAYNLASSLRRQNRHERALAYAKRALEQARALGAPELLAVIRNLKGNILLSQTYPAEALSEYQQALALREAQARHGEDTRYSRAIVLDNLGYCLLLMHRVEEGVERIRSGLALAEEVEDRRCRAECLQDLCYGLLLLERHEEAIDLGARALKEANEAGYEDIAENCHYLLGELGNRIGDSELRDHHFEHLQERHPELPFLKDFLCAVDVTRIITLRR